MIEKMNIPTCESCGHYNYALKRGVGKGPDTCYRWPDSKVKPPYHHCGEHTRFALWLADDIKWQPYINCSCGRTVTIPEGQSEVMCKCGRDWEIKKERTEETNE